jgi:SAM-dependent methyltransferase
MTALRFHAERPTDLRAAAPWHRLAYIVQALPAALERLSAELQIPAGGRVLDYGSAESPYRRFFAPGTDFVAADLAGNPDADVVIAADGTVPLEGGSFDAVLSTQVLEHVTDPAVYLGECFRLLRPGGRMLLSTHGLMVYHPDPVDLWRWTCAGLEHQVRGAGFEIRRFEGIMGLSATGLQLFQDAVYYNLPRPLRPALALVLQTLIRIADRLQSDESRRLNALVFALVAEKP